MLRDTRDGAPVPAVDEALEEVDVSEHRSLALSPLDSNRAGETSPSENDGYWVAERCKPRDKRAVVSTIQRTTDL